MITTNFTELRKYMKGHYDSMIDDSEALIINRDCGNAAMILSLDEYNSIKETVYLMQPAIRASWIRGGDWQKVPIL